MAPSMRAEEIVRENKECSLVFSTPGFAVINPLAIERHSHDVLDQEAHVWCNALSVA